MSLLVCVYVPLLVCVYVPMLLLRHDGGDDVKVLLCASIGIGLFCLIIGLFCLMIGLFYFAGTLAAMTSKFYFADADDLVAGLRERERERERKGGREEGREGGRDLGRKRRREGERER